MSSAAARLYMRSIHGGQYPALAAVERLLETLRLAYLLPIIATPRIALFIFSFVMIVRWRHVSQLRQQTAPIFFAVFNVVIVWRERVKTFGVAVIWRWLAFMHVDSLCIQATGLRHFFAVRFGSGGGWRGGSRHWFGIRKSGRGVSGGKMVCDDGTSVCNATFGEATNRCEIHAWH
ncbi:hypothetical protein BKA63DRAFT_1459, partial [Paraphoma chrysanthemicola]